MNFNSRAASLTVSSSVLLLDALLFVTKLFLFFHRRSGKEEGFFLFLLILQREGLIYQKQLISSTLISHRQLQIIFTELEELVENLFRIGSALLPT